jgi:hypothetical protein
MSKRNWLAATWLLMSACSSPAADGTTSNTAAGGPPDEQATAGTHPAQDADRDAATAPTAAASGAGGNNPGGASDAAVNGDGDDGAGDARVATDSAIADSDAAASAPDAQTPADPGFVVGVNVHNYPKPTAYGFVEADGGDRMGTSVQYLGVRYVRGPTIGDVAFLARLASFGVTHVILGLDAKSYGKPFDPARLEAALELSAAEVTRLGLHAVVEGLNEWDLFNTRTYNDGVEPAGVDTAQFVALTQRALYEAAHPMGIAVLGPSVGHSQDQANLDFFPDVAAYVDIVNVHLYFGTNPESLAVAEIVAGHQAFQGSNKPVWVTETGVSAFGGVSEAEQADIITRGLTHFAASHAIDAAFLYQLIDHSEPGWSGSTFTPDSGEYHFGLFSYGGAAKPAADAVKTAILTL